MNLYRVCAAHLAHLGKTPLEGNLYIKRACCLYIDMCILHNFIARFPNYTA